MLFSILAEHARRDPEKVALVFEGASIRYGAMAIRIERIARRLTAARIGRGTLVATAMDNGIDNLLMLLALARVGARVATLDGGSTPFELAQICADCAPEVVIAHEKYREKMRDAATLANPEVRVVSETTAPASLTAWLEGDLEGALPEGPFGGSFLIQYTSGSTGKPKGVVQSQEGLCHRLRDWNRTASLGPDDTHLCILPLSHGYGSYCVSLPALASGGTLHLMDLTKVTPRRVLQYVQDQRVNCFYGLPSFYQLMANIPRTVAADLSHLRIAMCGSAPVTEETAVAFLDRFGVKLNNTYGTSEIGLITSNLDHDPGTPLSAVGKLIAGIEAKLEPGAESIIPGAGELVVRSLGLAEGYFAAADGPMLKDGWLRTGDLAQQDERGNFTVVGRLSQFINVSGNKVMPGEIEPILLQMEGVIDAAVIGVPDPLTTQRVAAFVVTDRPLTEDDVRRHCREKLAGFKVPHYVRFRASLPKSTVGKVQKSKLRLDEA